MKRVLYSFLLSILLFCFWLLSSFLLEALNFLHYTQLEVFAIPFRLPKYIYVDLLNLEFPEDSFMRILLLLSAVLFNLILYSTFFYFLLSLFSRLKKTEPTDKSKTPPKPPVFK